MENCQTQENIWEREGGREMALSVLVTLSAIKDNRRDTSRQDEVLQLIAAYVHTLTIYLGFTTLLHAYACLYGQPKNNSVVLGTHRT